MVTRWASDAAGSAWRKERGARPFDRCGSAGGLWLAWQADSICGRQPSQQQYAPAAAGEDELALCFPSRRSTASRRYSAGVAREEAQLSIGRPSSEITSCCASVFRPSSSSGFRCWSKLVHTTPMLSSHVLSTTARFSPSAASSMRNSKKCHRFLQMHTCNS